MYAARNWRRDDSTEVLVHLHLHIPPPQIYTAAQQRTEKINTKHSNDFQKALLSIKIARLMKNEL